MNSKKDKYYRLELALKKKFKKKKSFSKETKKK